jgi:hypothetical protein
MTQDSDKEYNYILFPLPLLQEVFKNPQNGFSHIFNYGIYMTASTQDVSDENAIMQVLYCFYRGGLTRSLDQKLKKLVAKKIFIPDEDYNGFSSDGKEFYPEEEVSAIRVYLPRDSTLHDEIVEFHQLRQIKDVLNITFDIEGVINTCKDLNKEYGGFPKSPRAMISTAMMFDFYKNPKSEFEKVLFATYAGIRSIIGQEKKFCETTQQMIFARMVGAKNNEALIEALKNEKIKAIYEKYTVRYQKDKILNELVGKKFLASKIAVNRRTYLSCTLGYDELTNEIKNKINRAREGGIQLVKANERRAREKIRRHLEK